MMFTPCWPSAGPTGGAGLAAPAGICSLIMVMTFLAMSSSFRVREAPVSAGLFDLLEPELDGRFAAEDRDHHLELVLVGVDLGDLAREVGQRTRGDAHDLADRELGFLLGAFDGSGVQDTVDLGPGKRHGLVGGAHKTGHARRVFDRRPRFVGELHLHQDVPREDPLLSGDLLAVLGLDNLFGGHHDAHDGLLLSHRDDAVLEVLPDLVLVARVRVDHIPLEHTVSVSVIWAGRTAWRGRTPSRARPCRRRRWRPRRARRRSTGATRCALAT